MTTGLQEGRRRAAPAGPRHDPSHEGAGRLGRGDDPRHPRLQRLRGGPYGDRPGSFIPSIPPSWHVTQFYPTYHLLDKPRTPLATLRKAPGHRPRGGAEIRLRGECAR
ncbi:MAG: hypothetical protein MZV70_58800 [Desulfobacterales bacterium]|nr:hypothetical protein [Desulfobacterales bacterium]